MKRKKFIFKLLLFVIDFLIFILIFEEIKMEIENMII